MTVIVAVFLNEKKPVICYIKSQMIKGPKLTPAQWKLLSSAFSNIGQAIILFSLAAIFVPQVVNLPGEFPSLSALSYFFGGTFLLWTGVIIAKKEN